MKHLSGVFFALAIVLVAACASASTPADGGVSLDRLRWCEQPTIAFADESVTPAATISDWGQARPALGFAPLLPATLPPTACLASAGGVVHDPNFGGRFIIIYALVNHGALSIAETPARGDTPPQSCAASASGSSGIDSICQVTRDGLDITLSSTLAPGDLQSLASGLQANVAWVPTAAP